MHLDFRFIIDKLSFHSDHPECIVQETFFAQERDPDSSFYKGPLILYDFRFGFIFSGDDYGDGNLGIRGMALFLLTHQ